MKAIGIVGGVGPTAGTDLANKVFRHTNAHKDQEHINLYLTSCPSIIPDRTGFLLSGGADPAPGITECIRKLALCGADAVGIACNTAHSPHILKNVKVPEGVVFVNMIDSTCKEISKRFGKSKIGIIATLGTIRTGIYKQYFDNYPDLELVIPPEETCEEVHRAIYDPEYGIKSTPRVSARASDVVKNAVKQLKDMGCSAVILGCTELPLVFPEPDPTLIDPTDILAMNLIRATEPQLLV
jgi:aspartate racemase